MKINRELVKKIERWDLKHDPTLDGLVELCKEFYADGNEAGGLLHLVLDDGNIEDDHIEFCMNAANNNGDIVAFCLGDVLFGLSIRQRELLYKKLWD